MPSHVAGSGCGHCAGPLSGMVNVTKRVAAQLGSSATGSSAACEAAVATLTSSTVVSPPRPWAPMRSALTRWWTSIRKRSAGSPAPRASSSGMSIGVKRARLASAMACSGEPPTPSPSTPGGHQPAPMPGSCATTQSATESLGLSMA